MTVAPRILVVDDDAAIAEMVSIILSSHGLEVETASDGPSGLAAARAGSFDVILLDVMLPHMDGIEVCRRIREASDVPIIMLTARSDTVDVVRGLEAGADDYLTKPFEPTELIARIRARVRRRERKEPERLTIRDIEIDAAAHRVMRDGQTIPVTPLEFDLLLTLARRPWQAFSRDVLLRDVWGYTRGADPRLVNVHVQRLRSKVERDPENPEIIVTVRGVGYRAGD